jgi:hypothetical protein
MDNRKTNAFYLSNRFLNRVSEVRVLPGAGQGADS